MDNHHIFYYKLLSYIFFSNFSVEFFVILTFDFTYLGPVTAKIVSLYPDLVPRGYFLFIYFLHRTISPVQSICVLLIPNFTVSVHLRGVSGIEAGLYGD